MPSHVQLSLKTYNRLKSEAEKPKTIEWAAFFCGLLMGGFAGLFGGFGIASNSQRPLSPPGVSATNSKPPFDSRARTAPGKLGEPAEEIPDPVRSQ